MSSCLFSRFKEPFEKVIQENLSFFGPKTRLRNAIEYALCNGGKRFRPAIVYLVAEAVNKQANVTHAALAVEYFHTASLIADDLPCMDDDDKRRDHPSLHKAFDESTAILATYALISAGYDFIRLAAQKLNRDDVGMLAIENASYNTGVWGAVGGQYLDLHASSLSQDEVLAAIDKKTGTLFEISFVFGWLFGGGAIESLAEVKQAALSFGRAFQISDDLLDYKEKGKEMNFVSTAGEEKSLALLLSELENYREQLKKLRLDSPELLALAQLVEKRVALFAAV